MYRTTGVKAVKKEASHGVKVSVLSELLSLGPGETTRVLRSGVVCLLRLVGVHILTLALFLALDAVWLGLIARDMYRRELSQLLAPGVQWGAAGTFYVLYYRCRYHVSPLSVPCIYRYRIGTTVSVPCITISQLRFRLMVRDLCGRRVRCRERQGISSMVLSTTCTGGSRAER